MKADWKHPYLNFHCWSVDGSDSMSINKQDTLKNSLFTLWHSVGSLNIFASDCNVYYDVLANSLTCIRHLFSGICFGISSSGLSTLNLHFVNLRNFLNKDSIWSRVVLEFLAAPESLSVFPK